MSCAARRAVFASRMSCAKLTARPLRNAAIPTDTVYGISVALETPGGIERLYAAKERPPDKAIMVLVDSLEQAGGLVVVSDLAAALAGRFWPGGLTLVLPVRAGSRLPAALIAGTATLGVRMPNHATPRALAGALGTH